MSSNNDNSGPRAVRNLLAFFEDNLSGSPRSRGRSPALSEASTHSRPVSNVRASFVAVRRPSDIEGAQQWGLRKASGINTMADTKQEQENSPLLNGDSSHTPDQPPQSNALQVEPDPGRQLSAAGEHPPGENVPGENVPGENPSGENSPGENPPVENPPGENPQGGLGDILKGSAFETSPPNRNSESEDTGTKEASTSPVLEQKDTAATTTNGTFTPAAQSKSVGGRIKNAISSKHRQPPPAVKLNSSKDTKPIKAPPTRQVPPVKPSQKPPMSPRTPRAPISPVTEKPMTRGSATKPMAVAESAKNRATSDQAKSPTLPKETRRFSLGTQSSTTAAAVTAARRGSSSPKASGLKKDAKQSSPETKPRSYRAPASAIAPTAASAARNSNPSTLQRKPTTTKRDDPPAKNTNTTAPATKKDARISIPAQTNGTDSSKPKGGGAGKATDNGILARLMRPTASSAQKAHDKVSPSSPPQSKRAATMQAVKSKARMSLTRNDEDKENSQQGGQGIDSSPSPADVKQVNAKGDDKADSQPLNDITPAAEPVAAITAESKNEALEASSA